MGTSRGEDNDDRVMQSMYAAFNVSSNSQLSTILERRLADQWRTDKAMREFIGLRSVDSRIRNMQRDAVELLGRHPSEENIRGLIRCIDVANPPKTVSSDGFRGTVPLHYPCVFALTSQVRELAVLPILNRVACRPATHQFAAPSNLELELLSYTVLSVRTPQRLGSGESVGIHVRKDLIAELEEIHRQSGSNRPEDVVRFKEYLSNVEPGLYRYVNINYEKGLRFPNNSELFKWDEEKQSVVFLPVQGGEDR